ncbi:MAG: redoxin domain-containing protein [Armatimonadetes bacterium]|nr:redoxin domain-containing protein [Armatimonadota bacterium]
MMITTALATLLLAQLNDAPAGPLPTGTWINTEKPISWESRKGKVTLVHFWTFACSNCKANLPAYNNFAKEFEKRGVMVIGIHTPELEFEKDEANVRKAVEKQKITYPVAIDAKGEIWNAWKQQVWPTIYVIDKKGTVRGGWIGELEYGKGGGNAFIRKLVERCLAEKS